MPPETKNRFALWVRAVRAPFFTASLIPVLTGAALTLYYGTPAAWAWLPLIALGAVSFHAGTNLTNDYYDHGRGVDTPTSFGSSKVIQEGLLTPRAVLRAGLLFFALGTLVSLPFLFLRGPTALVLLALALLGGYLYTGTPFAYKYVALGDLFVFLLMGPLMVVGTSFVLTGRWDGRVLAASLPVGFLVSAILHANNLRDIEHDRAAGVRTFANTLGPEKAKSFYALLLGAAYLAVSVMIFDGTLPWLAVSVGATLPLARRNLAMVRPTRRRLKVANSDLKVANSDLKAIDVATAQLHLAFGLLYIVSLVLASLLVASIFNK
ncbi:MAG: 1,4-dihydroxy-2-naphthoate octaprenyltransferase [Deltaproteobacteria bacterium]